MKSKYKDCNDEIISYGDILRCLGLKDLKRDKFSPKEPFCMLCKLDGQDMMYVSGMDEYTDLLECKLKTDKIDELKGFEIFAYREIYESVNNSK